MMLSRFGDGDGDGAGDDGAWPTAVSLPDPYYIQPTKVHVTRICLLVILRATLTGTAPI